jgi:hypothetical protein
MNRRNSRILLGLVIAAAVSVRLFRITQPGLFDFHSWRQGDSAAFAGPRTASGWEI